MAFNYPLQGEQYKSTSSFGPRWGSTHKGVDLKANSGTRVLAAAQGEVVKSDDNSDPSGYGGQILIKHNIDGKTYYTRYAHLRKRYVQTGEKVSAGEKIGESGGGDNDANKGRATGPHLHFEVLDYGMKPLNPEPFLTGAALASTTSGDDKDKNKEKDGDNTKSDEKDLVGDIMKGFMSGYAPVGYLSSIGGLAGLNKESDNPQPIIEEIERIKELLK